MIRVLTALALLAVLVGTLWLPPIAFVVVLAVFLAVGWGEYAALAAAAGASPLRGLGAPLAIACALSFAAEDARMPIVALGGAAVFAAVAGLAGGRRHPGLAVRRTVATLGGVCWLGLLPGFYVAVRYQDNGVVLIALLFAAIGSGDTAAYYGGTVFGRRPLAPNLSPKKTIEGAAFGLAASAAAAAFVAFYWLPDANWLNAALVGLVLGIVGQAGDLFESAVKRVADVKDSSTLLPGHGGVLDRLDGVLFGGPVLYAAAVFDLL